MDSFLLLAVVVVALLFVGNRDSGRVGDWGRLDELTARPASTEVGDDIRILILVSAALATFRMNGWFYTVVLRAQMIYNCIRARTSDWRVRDLRC